MGLFKKKKKELLEIEVSEKNVGLRIAGAVILLLIGLGFLAYFLISMLTVEKGWTTIEVNSGNGNINDEFIFNYNVGQGEESATKEWKKVSDIYTAAANEAYELFDKYQSYDGVVNLYSINRNAGKELKVSPILYKAFEKIEKSGNRAIYLAPIYSAYNNLFFSNIDAEAKESDPYFNEEAAKFASDAAGFAIDPEKVNVELLGDNKIKLKISEDYLEFIKLYGIEDVIDFAYLTNAFVVDHIAERMIAEGKRYGNITSYDGYARNLDASGNIYAINLFDKVGLQVYSAAAAQYNGATAIVSMRNYPLSSQEEYHYYGYADGNYANRFVNAKNGRYLSCTNNIMSYSHSKGCADVALELSKIFIAEELDVSAIEKMRDGEIFTVWFDGNVICYNDKDIAIGNLYVGEDREYSANYIGNK